MNWKHYVSIIVPYAIAAGVAILTVASHSTDARVAAVAVLVLAAFNHRSVLAPGPEVAK